MKHMNLFGRVAVCGAISSYNLQDEEPKGMYNEIYKT